MSFAILAHASLYFLDNSLSDRASVYISWLTEFFARQTVSGPICTRVAKLGGLLVDTCVPKTFFGGSVCFVGSKFSDMQLRISRVESPAR